jgi:hypothetical protein
MRAFDATGARLYCDYPQTLNDVLTELESQGPEYARRRAAAVARLTCLPLEGVVDRVCEVVRTRFQPPGLRVNLGQVAAGSSR